MGDDIYEIEVELRQTALIPVRAPDRSTAWDKLDHPRDRETQELFAKMNFSGATYEIIDVIAVNGTDKAELTAGVE